MNSRTDERWGGTARLVIIGTRPSDAAVREQVAEASSLDMPLIASDLLMFCEFAGASPDCAHPSRVKRVHTDHLFPN